MKVLEDWKLPLLLAKAGKSLSNALRCIPVPLLLPGGPISSEFTGCPTEFNKF